MTKKVKYLVVDTTPFIQNANLYELGDNIVTVQNVLDEIKNKRQLQHLASTPYNLDIQTVFPENVKFVIEASKKIGEYTSLSVTDIKVIALTYQLEKFYVGSDHLKSIEQLEKVNVPIIKPHKRTLNSNTLTVNRSVDTNAICDETDENPDDSDENWITLENIEDVKKSLDGLSMKDDNESEQITVACLTTDYAIQNVLKQIGLKLVSIDGRVIKDLRTYIFRCHSCFKTTSNMTKVFCPNCGNRTLKKVAMLTNEYGEQYISINFKKPISIRGTKFSIPQPRGGHHGFIPYLTEDTKLPTQKATLMAMTKNNPLHPDFIAGSSPFQMRDVNSVSSKLGIRSLQKHGQLTRRRNCSKKK